MGKLTKAKKGQLKRVALLTFSICLMAVILFFLIFQIIGLIRGKEAVKTTAEKKKAEIDYTDIRISKPDIRRKLLTKNKNSRPDIPLEEVRGIVIHYTANPATDAMANRNYFENRKDMPDEIQYKVSSHFIIGLDGKIVQCIPLNEIAYASNDRNSDTISIECCHPDEDGKFTEETYQSLVRLCAWLCAKFHLQRETIIRHYDVTQKLCPLYYVEHEDAWEKLRDEIVALIQSGREKRSGN